MWSRKADNEKPAFVHFCLKTWSILSLYWEQIVNSRFEGVSKFNKTGRVELVLITVTQLSYGKYFSSRLAELETGGLDVKRSEGRA